jgi:hypothetical protein
LEEIIFETFNISENNIISVELAKVLKYLQRQREIGTGGGIYLQKKKMHKIN